MTISATLACPTRFQVEWEAGRKAEPMKKDGEAKKSKRDIWEPRGPNDPPLTPGCHEQLWQIASRLPTDFEPYGQRVRDGVCDCSFWFPSGSEKIG
jgi:hypothetical protein